MSDCVPKRPLLHAMKKKNKKKTKNQIILYDFT